MRSKKFWKNIFHKLFRQLCQKISQSERERAQICYVCVCVRVCVCVCVCLVMLESYVCVCVCVCEWSVCHMYRIKEKGNSLYHILRLKLRQLFFFLVFLLQNVLLVTWKQCICEIVTHEWFISKVSGFFYIHN